MFNLSSPKFLGSTEEKTVQIEQFLASLINELNHTSIDEAQDYVIEQVKSEVWSYRKWKSGIVECWTKVEKNIGSCTLDASTQLYISNVSLE